MRKIRVAINGLGRIGRNILRAFYENHYADSIEIVAVNDLGDPAIITHLLQFDSVHGHFNYPISFTNNQLHIGEDRLIFCNEKQPDQLPWQALDIDVVFECTGLFTSREKADLHLQAGAKKVLISAPATGADATIVYGLNHQSLSATDKVISNASCTTNCLAPIAAVLHRGIGIEQGLMTTIHAYTNDQRLLDMQHSDPYRSRSAAQSMIPTQTGAAKAVGLVLPELAGKLNGMAVRVPTANVSLVDLSFIAQRETSVDEIHQLVREAASGALKGVLAVNDLPLVSCDFNHNRASSIFDTNHTRVEGRLVKVLAWYDNEWGFSNRMLDLTTTFINRSSATDPF